MALPGLLLWLVLLVGFTPACSQESQSDLPNIVFMIADDLGYGDVGYNGGAAHTPNLDSMAAGPNTIHLTRYYSGGPVCSPTRGTLLTGRNHNRYCIWFANVGSDSDDFVIPQRMPLPTTELTIGELLKPAGYHTGFFGKWHLGDLRPVERGNPKWPVSHPGMHGFQEWLVTGRAAATHNLNCACFEDASSHCQPLGHYTDLPPCSNYYGMDANSTRLQHVDAPIRGDDSLFLLNKFEDFLGRAVGNNQPFFVILAFHSVHIRYIASPEMAQKYLLMGYDQNHADYFGTLSAMDTAVGGVRRLLRQYNISHNTMLWFTSDNGPLGSTPGSTGGLRGSKGSLYEGGVRVPGLIEWPAMITHNRVSDFPVVSNDVLPTVGDIIGNQTSDVVLDGISVLPMIKGEQRTRNSTIKWAFKIPGNFSGRYRAAISGDRFKVYASYNNDRVVSASLYDLVTDSAESMDVKENYVEEFQALKQELEEWRQSLVHSVKYEAQCLNFTDSFFECEEKLISFNHRCNAHRDCWNNFDEINCDFCWYNTFHCANNKCIDSSSVCNGRNNCGDNSDEACKLCLPSAALCNGVSDCMDSSDENDCGSHNHSTSTSFGHALPTLHFQPQATSNQHQTSSSDQRFSTHAASSNQHIGSSNQHIGSSHQNTHSSAHQQSSLYTGSSGLHFSGAQTNPISSGPNEPSTYSLSPSTTSSPHITQTTQGTTLLWVLLVVFVVGAAVIATAAVAVCKQGRTRLVRGMHRSNHSTTVKYKKLQGGGEEVEVID